VDAFAVDEIVERSICIARDDFDKALGALPELSELDELIVARGYDPQAIDAYFFKHPGQLASRAVTVTRALTSLANLAKSKKYDELVDSIERLGPTYVKFGQAFASRSDLIGGDLAAALEKLQDGMAAAPIEEARAIVALECPKALPVLYQVRSIQKFFTHRPVSTLDRIPFQLTDELFLYGMALRATPSRRRVCRRCTEARSRGRTSR
jgi:hypothetical protein